MAFRRQRSALLPSSRDGEPQPGVERLPADLAGRVDAIHPSSHVAAGPAHRLTPRDHAQFVVQASPFSALRHAGEAVQDVLARDHASGASTPTSVASREASYSVMQAAPVMVGLQLLTGSIDVAETTLRPAVAVLDVLTSERPLPSPGGSRTDHRAMPSPSIRAPDLLLLHNHPHHHGDNGELLSPGFKHAARNIADMAQVCQGAVRH